MIGAIAVIGKTNSPLYIWTASHGNRSGDKDTQAAELAYHYYVHTALDECLEKAASRSSGVDLFLGILCPVEDFKVYGYVSNTDLKFLTVIRDMPLKDNDVKVLLRRVHMLYVDAMCNPFAQPGETVKSHCFERDVRKTVVHFNKVLSSRT